MKKVLIVSLYGNSNYGNKLQNYALSEVIKKMGLSADVLKYEVVESSKREIRSITFKKVIELVKDKVLTFKLRGNVINKRVENFNYFNKFISYTESLYKSGDDFYQLDKLYDFNIVGSDQIFNPIIAKNSFISFVSFSNKKKNISYAASFGVSSLDEKQKKLYSRGLKNFSFVSVRETEGKKLLDSFFDNESIVNVDPTLLLTRSDWDLVMRKPDNFTDEKYILTYFLGRPSKEVEKIINKYSKEKGYKIIALNDKSKQDYYSFGPAEFIYLFKNCDKVYTDSFHAVIFSLIYHKDFEVFDRNDLAGKTSSRIRSLFKLLNIKDISTIDYKKVDECIEIEKTKGINYLKSFLIQKENYENKKY